MAPVTLRPHQQRSYQAVLEAYANRHKEPKVLVYAATGSGKTHVIEHAALAFLAQGLRVLVLADSIKLLEQTYARLFQTLREWPIRLRCTGHYGQPWKGAGTLVAGVKSLPEPGPDGFGIFGRFDVVFVDECHLATTPLYMRVLKWVAANNALAVGLTATPVVSKGRERLPFRLISSYPLADAIADGVVARPIGRVVAVDKLNLAAIPLRGGDYATGALNSALREPDVMAEMAKVIAELKGLTLVFCSSRAHTRELAAAINQAAGAEVAGAIYSSVPNRQEVWDAFVSGAKPILTNVRIVTTGIDVPAVANVVFAVLTRNPRQYIQILGRGGRLIGDKSTFTVVDFAGSSQRNRALTMDDVLASLGDEPVPPKKKRSKKVDRAALLEKRSTLKGLRIPATEIQQFELVGGDSLVAYLVQAGVPAKLIKKHGPAWAARCRDLIASRKAAGLATWRQCASLRRNGFGGSFQALTAALAGKIIGEINQACNKQPWRHPATLQMIKDRYPEFAK